MKTDPLPDEEHTSAKRVAREIADELKAHPERWFQGALVKFANGASTSTGYGLTRDDAVCWCLEGLIGKRFNEEVRCKAIIGFKHAVGFEEALNRWNDAPGRTVEDVIALCEKVSQS